MNLENVSFKFKKNICFSQLANMWFDKQGLIEYGFPGKFERKADSSTVVRRKGKL